MSELDDLRGRTIVWMVSRAEPLLCALSTKEGDTGSLVQDGSKAPYRCWLASIEWSIEAERCRDVVRFTGFDSPIATGRSLSMQSYETEIDGLARYRCVALPQVGKLEWFDARNRKDMALRRHRNSLRCQSGEIIVSIEATLEHVPILVLLGLIRLIKKPNIVYRDLIG